MSKALYTRGPQIRDLCAVVALMDQGTLFYWSHDPRPKPPAFLIGMTLRTLGLAAKRGHLRLALRIEDLKL